MFARIWPDRDNPFARQLNAMPKLVASRTLTELSAWSHCDLLTGDPVDVVKNERRDVVITGSIGVVHALMAQDLIDEYRLLTFPTVLGSGERLFPDGTPSADLDRVSAEQSGAAVLARFRRR